MKLKDLLSDYHFDAPVPQELVITGLSSRSSEVHPGNLFIALDGLRSHGLDHMEEALQQGAAAILSNRRPERKVPVPLLVHAHPEKLVMPLGLKYYKNPEKKLSIAGITGTNGKTTTGMLLRHLLGTRSAFIGTTEIRMGEKRHSPTHTTPPALDLCRLLRQTVDEGCDSLIMEISSHALDQKRIFGLPLKVAVFTNLQRDHLDYHGTMSSYFTTKKKIFRLLKKDGTAVVNISDPFGAKLVRTLRKPLVTYGWCDEANFHVVQTKLMKKGTFLEMRTPKGNVALTVPLIGTYNVENTMAAVSAGQLMGLEFERLRGAISSFPGVPGRLERVSNSRNLQIFVDYAHTPEGIESVLSTVQRSLNKKIISVLGAGGDRDPGKRYPMGLAAGRHSDIVILTSDNPRSEDPAKIAAELLRGVRESGQKKVLTILDRSEAIQTAVQLANNRFAVVLLGKGHESYQIVGPKTFPFNDREEANRAIRELSHAVYV